MPLTGDWARLQATIRGMRNLANVPAQAAKLAAEEVQTEIEQQFDAARDPYGHAWAPHAPATVRRWGAHRLLQLTGAGRAGLRVRPLAGAGIAVEMPSDGLAFAQGGTRFEPKRRILPEDRLPKTWRAAIERAVKRSAEEALKNAG